MYENRHRNNKKDQECLSRDAIIHSLNVSSTISTKATFCARTKKLSINLPSNETNKNKNDEIIIRIEDYGMNWYIDGNQLELPVEEWQKFDLRPQARADQTNAYRYWERRIKTCPYIVMREGMEIINIEIDEAAY